MVQSPKAPVTPGKHFVTHGLALMMTVKPVGCQELIPGRGTKLLFTIMAEPALEEALRAMLDAGRDVIPPLKSMSQSTWASWTLQRSALRSAEVAGKSLFQLLVFQEVPVAGNGLLRFLPDVFQWVELGCIRRKEAEYHQILFAFQAVANLRSFVIQALSAVR